MRIIKSLSETKSFISFYFGLQLTNSYTNVFKRQKRNNIVVRRSLYVYSIKLRLFEPETNSMAMQFDSIYFLFPFQYFIANIRNIQFTAYEYIIGLQNSFFYKKQINPRKWESSVKLRSARSSHKD